MDTEQLELLKHDLINFHFNRYSGPNRKEIEIIVNSTIDAVANMAKQIAEEIMDEHEQRFQHEYKEEY